MVEMLERKCVFESFTSFEAGDRARPGDESDTLQMRSEIREVSDMSLVLCQKLTLCDPLVRE